VAPLPRYRIYTSPGTYGAILAAIATGRRLRGDDCRALEQAVEAMGVAHAISVKKARLAIFLAVRALIRPGQEVVLSPYTISDAINMVICAGGVPVFADIERETCNIDPAEIERLVDDATGAVLVTHLHGLACDMERIGSICRERGVPLIEDAAQAFGTRCNGRRVGTLGDAGIYSFGMYKNATSFYGGMVVTGRDDVAERVRDEVASYPPHELVDYLMEVLRGVATDLATWPPLFRSLTYPVFRFGFLRDIAALNNQVTVERNPELKEEIPDDYLRQMTPLQARLLLRRIGEVDDDSRARVRAAEVYHAGLSDLTEVALPPLRGDLSHTYTYFPIQVQNRDELLRHLMRERRDVAAQHLKNCADLPCFEIYHRDCPRARETARSLVLLPTYPRYGMAEVERNVTEIRRHFGAPDGGASDGGTTAGGAAVRAATGS
jgi:dTDP-4-amino-4,6-dideoxygalactose transaminase